MRLFFALWPPAETAAALEGWARGCEGRVVPAANIHLTLAFLGEAEPAKAVAAARRVQGNAQHLPIQQARYWKHNQIVWVGPDEIPHALAELVSRLHLELYRQEFILERRPFAAHVALLRKAAPPRAFPTLPRVEWPVAQFLLVRSTTSREGARYEPLERFALP